MPYWNLFYHIVWSTKSRQPLILPEFENSLHNVIAARATRLDGKVYAVGGIENHIHLVVSVPPKIALSDFISQVKGNSAHFVIHELNHPFGWQAEYGVLSFGGKQLNWVVRYVRNQGEHHNNHQCYKLLEICEN